MTNAFQDWLNEQTQDRGWSFGELSRRSGVSSAMISDVINNKANPGLHFCVGVARALGEPPESVLRLAGLLPPLPPAVAEEREAVSLLRQLPARFRAAVLAQLRALSSTAPPDRIHEPPAPYDHRDPLERDLLREFRELPAEWQQEALREIRRLQRYAAGPRIIGDEPD